MTRPHGLLRAGYPYSTTLGMRRVTNFPTDIAFGENDILYVLLRSEGVASVRIWSTEDLDELTDELKGFGSFGSEDGQLKWPVNIITDDSGGIFISDEANHRITKYDQEGNYISKFGINGDGQGEDIYNGGTGGNDYRGNIFLWGGVVQKYRGYMKRNAVGPYPTGPIGMDKKYK